MPDLTLKKSLFTDRIISSIAATVISLACGTNYAYSVWGPQFADKLKFSSTQQNIIGLSGNLGMYLLGIPIGIFVDSNGARTTVISGGTLIGIGYFVLCNSYSTGSGYLPLLCIFSFLTGAGGCASFSASIKVSALNWPQNRGTATAFPVAAFGLSAFFFSSLGQLLVPGDTFSLLLILAIGTVGLNYIGFCFLRIVELPEAHVASTKMDNYLDTNQLLNTKKDDLSSASQLALLTDITQISGSTADESAVLLSKIPVTPINNLSDSNCEHTSSLQIQGLKLLTRVEFWQLFSLMSILAGIAMMTINNIGNNVRALWGSWDKTKDKDFIVQQESLQVSIISVASSLGRIGSGIGSDLLIKVFKASRLWCLVFASTVFLVSQIFAVTIKNPSLLFLVSAPTGLAYGFLFGCFPSLVAEAFGIRALSQNFGAMTSSPIISVYIFNLFYGKIFDQNSIVKPDGYRECVKGLSCYQKAYYLTILACICGLVTSLWSVSYTYRLRQKKRKIVNEDEHEIEI